MTAKQKEIEAVKMAADGINPDADVHHMVRTFGTQPGEGGVDSVDAVDAAILTWVQAGYKLFYAHALSSPTPNSVRVLYILVKE